MAFFNRTKKEPEKKPAAKKEPPVKAEKKSAGFAGKIIKKEFTNAYKILQRPLVTEKSVNLSSRQNQYVFAVASNATKNEVKKIIQDLYGARVLRVNMLNTQGKKRRVGKHEGWKSGFKKAIVFLAAGEKIEVIAR